jgi:uncharacterized protein
MVLPRLPFPSPSGAAAWRRVRCAALCLMSLTIAAPAASQVQFVPEATGANYTVSVKTWWDIPFRSIVRQRYDFSCGSAAVATLLTYHYGMPTTEDVPFAAMWEKGDQAVIKKAGFSMFDMKTYFQSKGFQAEGYRMSVADLRKFGRPSIILLDIEGYKHFVVVKGVRNDVVLVGDSVRGLTQYPIDEFNKAWNGIVLAITKAPSNRVAYFNLARDWNPWSTAPIDATVQIAPIGDITNNLPPVYQLRPQILIDARVGSVAR